MDGWTAARRLAETVCWNLGIHSPTNVSLVECYAEDALTAARAKEQARHAADVEAYREGFTDCQRPLIKGPKGWDHSDAKRRLTEEEP